MDAPLSDDDPDPRTPKWWLPHVAFGIVAVALLVAGLVAQYSFLNGFKIVRFQLSGSVLRADALIAQAITDKSLKFDSVGQVASVIRESIWVDWLFIVVYTVALALGSVLVRKAYHSPVARGMWLTVFLAVFIGAGLDVLENLATLAYLAETQSWLLVAMAALGWVKSLTLFFALAYVVVGSLRWVVDNIGAIAVLRSLPIPDAVPSGEPGQDPMSVWSQPRPRPDSNPLKSDGRTAGVGPRSSGSGTVKYDPDSTQRVGVCSSGGGIRSASFSLGAYQALIDCDEFEKVDFLSAVSGGAYMAGAMTTIYSQLLEEGSSSDQPKPFANDSPELRHLRSNSFYLAPSLTAKVGAVGEIFLGIILNVLLIGGALALLAVPLGAFVASPILYPEMGGGFDDVGEASSNVSSVAESISKTATDDEGSTAIALVGEAGQLQSASAELSAAAAVLPLPLERAQATTKRVILEYRDQAIPLSEAEPLLQSVRQLQSLLSASAEVASRAAALASDARRAGATSDAVADDDLAQRAGALAGDAEDLSTAADRLGNPSLPVPGGWAAISLSLGLAVLVGVASASIPVISQSEFRRVLLVRTAVLLLAISLALLATMVVLPWLIGRGIDWTTQQAPALFAILQSAGVVTLVLGVARTLSTQNRSRLAEIAGGVVAPLMAIIAVIAFASVGAAIDIAALALWVGIFALVLALIFLLGDLNSWSMHSFYRRGLEVAFFNRRNLDGTESPGVRPLNAEEKLLSRAYPHSHDTSNDNPYSSTSGFHSHNHAPGWPPFLYHSHSDDGPIHAHRLKDGGYESEEGDRRESHTHPLKAEVAHEVAHEHIHAPQPQGSRQIPTLVICAAVNNTAIGTTPSGRNAMSLTFTPDEISSPGLGTVDLVIAESSLKPAIKRYITLPAAVAISGAAISPAMGKQTRKSLQALLALANVRLGVWLPNPAWLSDFDKQAGSISDKWERTQSKATKKIRENKQELSGQSVQSEDGDSDARDTPGWIRRLRLNASNCYQSRRWTRAQGLARRARKRVWPGRPRPTYLLKEILGIYRPWDKYVYVSDGGHWENLGLVELLRRRCTTIYCFDASGSPVDHFYTLAEAIAQAEADPDIPVEFDPYRVENRRQLEKVRARASSILPDGQSGDARDQDESNSDSADAPVTRMRSEEGFAKLDFHYRNSDGSLTPGRIVYVRATVPDEAPISVQSYQERVAAFPAHSTADQLFDHEQLEAYRALGYSNTDAALGCTKREANRK